ncbi:hypothetical protein [Methylomonas methanica]|uniref:Uncharacterized protein n=1 Tax=Methylomonas methanica (strain DSM 25384 / MC09) TaxID=857087 RepID=G0A3Y1_METMM|nr:hypothetical protein [Methylomonas methanica]AEG02753.1 hypothetical protein Metme_4406 [Methylomonas methanica MC09]
MSLAFQLLAHLIFLACMLALLILPDHRYAWMQAFDPALPAEAVTDPADNNLIFSFLLLMGACLTQTLLIVCSCGRVGKRVSVSLICAAAVFWAAKFWL